MYVSFREGSCSGWIWVQRVFTPCATFGYRPDFRPESSTQVQFAKRSYSKRYRKFHLILDLTLLKTTIGHSKKSFTLPTINFQVLCLVQVVKIIISKWSQPQDDIFHHYTTHVQGLPKSSCDLILGGMCCVRHTSSSCLTLHCEMDTEVSRKTNCMPKTCPTWRPCAGLALE